MPGIFVRNRPRAEGFRTLINSDGEEALAVFSTKDKLEAAS